MPEKIALLETITVSEALEWWGLKSPKTITNRLFGLALRRKDNTGIIRKSGKVYLTTIEAMIECFGQPQNRRPNYD